MCYFVGIINLFFIYQLIMIIIIDYTRRKKEILFVYRYFDENYIQVDRMSLRVNLIDYNNKIAQLG